MGFRPDQSTIDAAHDVRFVDVTNVFEKTKGGKKQTKHLFFDGKAWEVAVPEVDDLVDSDDHSDDDDDDDASSQED
jgi:hypothetical protein